MVVDDRGLQVLGEVAADLMLPTTDQLHEICGEVVRALHGLVEGEALLGTLVGKQGELGFVLTVTPFDVAVDQILFLERSPRGESDIEFMDSITVIDGFLQDSS